MKLRWALKIGEQSFLTQVFNRKYGRCGNINGKVMLSPIDSALCKSIVSFDQNFKITNFEGLEMVQISFWGMLSGWIAPGDYVMSTLIRASGI